MSDLSVFRNRERLTRHLDAPTPEAWELKWTATIPALVGCETQAVDGTFWAVSDDGFLSPLEASRGTPVWRSAIPGGREQPPTAVAVGADRVVVMLRGSVVAFDREGALLWQASSPDAADSSFASVDSKAVYLAHRDRVVARSCEDGSELWSAAADHPGPFVELDDRLVVPTRDAILCLEKATGAVIFRRAGGSAFALPYERPEPSLLVQQGPLSLEVLSLDGERQQHFSLSSVLNEGSREPRVLGLSSGATIVRRALFGGYREQGSWFRADLAAVPAPWITREGTQRDYACFASSRTHVFACTADSKSVDVFDHSMRWLGALATGAESEELAAPQLWPVPNGLLVQAGRRVTFFGAPAQGSHATALSRDLETPPLSARVVEQIRRLGGSLPAQATRRTLETRKGPVSLSSALSAFLSIKWPGTSNESYPHASEVTWKEGALFDPALVADFEGPLVVIAHAERSGTAYKVVLADDWSDDPLVFELYSERRPLPEGVRLSALLARMTPGKPASRAAPRPAPEVAPPVSWVAAIAPHLREAIRTQGADASPAITHEILRTLQPWDDEMIAFAVAALQKDARYAKTAFNSVLATGTSFLGAARALLSSPHEEVRYLAANYYGLLKTKSPEHAGALNECVGDLRTALGDASPRVIAAAAWSLGKIGAPEAADWLRPLVRDERRVVANAAAIAMRALGSAA